MLIISFVSFLYADTGVVLLSQVFGMPIYDKLRYVSAHDDEKRAIYNVLTYSCDC